MQSITESFNTIPSVIHLNKLNNRNFGLKDYLYIYTYIYTDTRTHIDTHIYIALPTHMYCKDMYGYTYTHSYTYIYIVISNLFLYLPA